MKKSDKAKWVEALRSGEYAQGQTVLRTTGNRYCCLGVLAEVCGIVSARRYYLQNVAETCLSPENAICLPEYIQRDLGRMNDSGQSFAQIADWIVANVPEDAE